MQHTKYIELLKSIIAIPSLSSEEGNRALFLIHYLEENGLCVTRIMNNLVVKSPNYDNNKGTVLLCAHLDTVKPSASYSFNPHEPWEKEGKLYGLGSNDCGASIVSMIATMEYFSNKNLPFNLLLVLCAEEETSGERGLSAIMPILERQEKLEMAIVGEPTSMEAAIAERGLMVLDGMAQGEAGHAAHNTGENALYIALDDINTLRNYKFDKVSPLLGKVKLNVTCIECGTQHNVIPDKCHFVVDIRSTDLYRNREILDTLQPLVCSKLTPRSFNKDAHTTPEGHWLLKVADRCLIKKVTSNTTSDWITIDLPAIKMGPGDSCRSHTADEFVFVHQIFGGIDTYIKYIEELAKYYENE